MQCKIIQAVHTRKCLSVAAVAVYYTKESQSSQDISFDLLFVLKEPALTTTASRSNPFFLTVALSAGGWAWGHLFWDDGDSLDTYEMGNYCYVTFIAGQVEKTQVVCICILKAD